MSQIQPVNGARLVSEGLGTDGEDFVSSPTC